MSINATQLASQFADSCNVNSQNNFHPRTVEYIHQIEASEINQDRLHHEYFKTLSENEKIPSMKTVIDWFCSEPGLQYYLKIDDSTNLLQQSNINDYGSLMLERGAKALLSFLVKYHGLAPNNPYGPAVFRQLIDNLESVSKKDFHSEQNRLVAFQCARFALTVCYEVPGGRNGSSVLDKSIEVMNKLFTFYIQKSMAERNGTGISNGESSNLVEDVKMINDLVHVLNKYDITIADASHISSNMVDDIVKRLRQLVIIDKVPSGKAMESIISLIEKSAVRKFERQQSRDNGGNAMAQVNADGDYFFENSCQEMDDEAQDDFEAFLKEVEEKKK